MAVNVIPNTRRGFGAVGWHPPAAPRMPVMAKDAG